MVTQKKLEELKEVIKTVVSLMKEDVMKDRIQIDGVWYKREDTLLRTDETLRVEGVEPIYSDDEAKLKLVFHMPKNKFNVGDEVVIHNLTKLRKAKKLNEDY